MDNLWWYTRQSKLVELSDFTPDNVAVDECERVFLGSYSLSTSVRRIVLKSASWESGEGEYWTPSAYARQTIKHLGMKPARYKIAQHNTLKDHISRGMPLLAYRGEFKDCVYLDVESAWYNIIARFGWVIDYWPNRWIGQSTWQGWEMPEGKNGKLARVCLSSCGFTNKTRVYTHVDGIKSIGGHNDLYNPHLHALTVDCMRSLAYNLYTSFDVRYIYTDGYILPMSQMEKAISLASVLGFNLRIKHFGDGYIYGVGHYTIGDFSSGGTARKDYNNLEECDTWIHRRLYRH